MKNQNKIIALLLIIAACAPSHVIANDYGRDIANPQQMHINKTCIELRKTLSDNEHSQLLVKDSDLRRELSCSCELLAEIEEEEKYYQEKNQDQQAAILEKLLLESTKQGISLPDSYQ